jgi:cysteine desulfurase family protein (TIGR01976 family)
VTGIPSQAATIVPQLDVEFCRAHFPNLANGWTYLDNAGGSYIPQSVVIRMNAFLVESKNQPYRHFASGALAAERLDAAYSGLADLMNADKDEVVIGPSTTANAYVLAQAIRPLLSVGDEIIVTNQDHESNNGCWRRLAEFGVKIVEWQIDPASGTLDIEMLDELLTSRTKLVCFTHVSNIVAAINPVAEISRLAHAAGARVVVDGVAYAGHALVDVKAWDVDFYLLSLYKLYGPHLGVLYGKRSVIEELSNQNHYFYNEAGATKLHPSGNQYEFVGAAVGILDYLDAVHAHHYRDTAPALRGRIKKTFDLFAGQETALANTLIDYLRSKPGVRVFGPNTGDRAVRMPTVAFHVAGRKSGDIARQLAGEKFAIAFGDFYSLRCLSAQGIRDLDDGVARVSMLHYNSVAEIVALTEAFDRILA